MSLPTTDSFLRAPTRRMLPAIFLHTYPVLTLLLNGGASAVAIAAAIVSLALLLSPKSWTGLGPIDWSGVNIRFGLAMACPLVAVLISEIWHGRVVPNTLDSPVRFVAAVPLFMVLRQALPRTLIWSDLSFALGGLASLAIILLLTPQSAGIERLSNSFLNPIHYGDIALVLGALSVLSLNWWRKDSLPIRIIKIAGLIAGVTASVLTGSRGGWIAVPVLAALILYVRGRGKSRHRNMFLTIAVCAIMVGAFFSAPLVQNRVDDISSDLTHYKQGQKDTSLGIRVQLYEAAIKIFKNSPVFGLGARGFHNDMQSFVEQGALTPMAAQLGKGETHNQFFAYLTDYGLIGGLALLSIYVVPGVIFWRRLNAPSAPASRAALMGLTFVVAFWIFGLTVETFDLKMTVSFYSTSIAILAALATYADKASNGQCPKDS